MTAAKLGIAVIGTGMAATPHARALRDLADRIEVRGVYSRRKEKREAFASEYGFPAVDSIDALADDPSVDAALLITPPNQRIDLVRRFAEAGKHILMEKPVERTTEAAEEIVRICETNRVRLGIVFQHRYREASQKLKALLDDGTLGEIRLVRASVPWWREQSYYDEPGRGTYERDGGGVLISQAIHTLDLMLSLTGPVAEVQAVAATTRFHDMESEDFVAGGMWFASGVPGAVMATTASFPGDAESITLDCEEASAHLQSGVLTINWRQRGVETIGKQGASGSGANFMDVSPEWHRDLIAAFADSVRAGRDPVPSGRDALDVHRLIDALIASSRERRAIEILSSTA